MVVLDCDSIPDEKIISKSDWIRILKDSLEYRESVGKGKKYIFPILETNSEKQPKYVYTGKISDTNDPNQINVRVQTEVCLPDMEKADYTKPQILEKWTPQSF
ncbi:TPA: hypothetical protein ACGO7R_000002 [Streptococcus suis]